jgi:hypothetical protein
MGFIQLQADKHLGKSYAGLLCFVEGLYHLGYLSKAQYLAHVKRYSIPLDKDPDQVALEEVEAARERKQLNRTFINVIQDWHLHQDEPEWQAYWMTKAKQNGELSGARRLLAFVEEQK